MQRITKGGWTYRVEQPYYEQSAIALKKLAQSVEDNADLSVQDGLPIPTPQQGRETASKVKNLANELRSLGSTVARGAVGQKRVEEILERLRNLGIFPDNKLVSEVARTFVMAEMDNVLPSEAEDFVNEVKRHRRLLEEFDVTATPQQLTGPGISPYRGTITIRNRKSGAERTYSTGHGSIWVAEFVRDLEAGVY